MNAELKYSFFLFLRLCVYRPRDTLAKAFFIERRLVSRQTGTVGCRDVGNTMPQLQGVERNCSRSYAVFAHGANHKDWTRLETPS